MKDLISDVNNVICLHDYVENGRNLSTCERNIRAQLKDLQFKLLTQQIQKDDYWIHPIRTGQKKQIYFFTFSNP